MSGKPENGNESLKSLDMQRALKMRAKKEGFKEFKNRDEMWEFLNNSDRLDPVSKYGYYGPGIRAIFKNEKDGKYYEVMFGETGEPKYYKQIPDEDAQKMLDIMKRLKA